MASRKRPAETASTEIPIDLYRGLARAIETGYPNGGPSSREMWLWSKRVRAAGYVTSRSLVAQAGADEGFQRWLFQDERKRRLCAESTTLLRPRTARTEGGGS